MRNTSREARAAKSFRKVAFGGDGRNPSRRTGCGVVNVRSDAVTAEAERFLPTAAGTCGRCACRVPSETPTSEGGRYKLKQSSGAAGPGFGLFFGDFF